MQQFPKLDKYMRTRLEQAYRERQKIDLKTVSDILSARLEEMAVRRVKRDYDCAQEDIPTLLKYNLDSKIETVIFYVYDPDTGRYERGIRVDVESLLLDYYAPSPCSSYVSIYVGGYGSSACKNTPAHWDHDSPDWRLAREVISLRATYEKDMTESMEKFKRDIRSTSSWTKIIEMYPWVAEVVLPTETTDGKEAYT